jgi:hypothetical protein
MQREPSAKAPIAKNPPPPPAPASAKPAASEAGSDTTPAQEFDVKAARAALDKAAAAARACNAPGGFSGAGRARILFGRNGTTLAVLLDKRFETTPIAGCIKAAFRRTRVPPFSGVPVSVSRSFVIL